MEVVIWWGFLAWVAPPSVKKAEEATLGSWRARAPRDICSTPSPSWIEEETKSQRGVGECGRPVWGVLTVK